MRNTLVKLLAASSLVAIAAAGSAKAADLPEAPAPVIVPVYNWSGFYIGGHIGGLFNGESKKDYYSDSYVLDGFDDDDDNDKTFIVGGQAGVNYQMGSFVVGVEADGSYLGFGDDEDDKVWELEPGYEGSGGHYVGLAEGGADWLVTVRGRLGFTFDRFLVYATGGVAFSDIDNGGFYDVSDDHDDDDDVSVGWTVGAGVEGFITPNITAKIEYLYVNFDEDDDNKFSFDFDDKSDDGLDAHLVRAGLNFKFNLGQ